MLNLKQKYAVVGGCLVPLFGRLALAGTGHEGDLYRYLVPMVVGSVAGYLLGTMKERWQAKVDELCHTNSVLLENEEKYREIFNAPGDAIIIYDHRTGRILEVNQAMLDMYGYSRAEIKSLKATDISQGEPPWDKSTAKKWVARTLKHGPQNFEWLSRRKNGEFFWSDISLKLARYGGQAHMIAVIRDIDQRKQAELALAREKEQLLVTLRSIGEGVITVDCQERVILQNIASEELTGWSMEKAQGQKLEKIFHLQDEKSGAPRPNPVTEVLQTGRTIKLDRSTVLVARDGTRRLISTSCAPIQEKSGDITGAVMVFRDVTKQLKMEQDLLNARKLESVGVLAGGIAHDFNNFLGAILGNISLVLQGLDQDMKQDQIRTRLENAQKATVRARGLTRQLLVFSQGGAPVKEVSSVEGLIIESADFVLHGSKTDCVFHLDPDLWPVNIDRDQFSQVIQNLVLNARQAMTSEGTITISAGNVPDGEELNVPGHGSGPWIRIQVTDTGQGIDPENINRIFDPYFTTRCHGTGLGLAVVHSIIQRHGGHISVSSEMDKGTTFTILLPARPEAVPVEETAPLRASTGSGTVLVMDDEEMILDICKLMLNRLGYTAILTRDGLDAVKLYRNALESGRKIDAVIMDLTIPGGMGGREAAEKILALDPDARLIVASGYSHDAVMSRHREHGFRAALCKPFDLDELGLAVQAALEKENT
ncbi:hybrid sensor histidine kinase/response regulator [Desulfolithobacter sp.]